MAEASGPSVREALSEVLAAQGDRLYALALRVTRDPDLAADAVQEAFASALDRVDDFRGEAALGTWLHRIVYNKSIDSLRRRSRETPLPAGGEEALLGPEDDRLARAPSWGRPPDEVLRSREAREALDAATGALTPAQRAVFELKVVDGLPTDEVAQILGLPEGTVRVHLHRARLRLRERLAEHFGGRRT